MTIEVYDTVYTLGVFTLANITLCSWYVSSLHGSHLHLKNKVHSICYIHNSSFLTPHHSEHSRLSFRVNCPTPTIIDTNGTDFHTLPLQANHSVPV